MVRFCMKTGLWDVYAPDGTAMKCGFRTKVEACFWVLVSPYCLGTA